MHFKKNEIISISLVLLSSFCYAVLNSIFKKIGHELSPLNLVFYRNLFLVIILTPLFFVHSSKHDLRILLQKNNLLLNTIRGSVGFLGICFWIIAVGKLPITECVAISFTTPLFITLLAILILKEPVSLAKWCCLILGFSGSLIVMSADFNQLNFYSLLVVCAAFLWATIAIVIKKFVTYHHPVPVIFFTAFISLILSTPSFVQEPILPENKQLFLIFISSALSASAQILMGFAYKRAAITLVVPFDFTRLIFTSAIAYIAFGEIISLSTIIGSVMIVLGAFFIVFIENRKNNES